MQSFIKYLVGLVVALRTSSITFQSVEHGSNLTSYSPHLETAKKPGVKAAALLPAL